MKKTVITSIFLSTIIALNTTGCSLQKNSEKFDDTTAHISTDIKDDYQQRMIDFIEKIENSNINLDMTNFYENAKTLKINISKDKSSVSGSYNSDTNTINISNDSEGVLEHELVHVILNNNKKETSQNYSIFLEEGFVELLTSEICNTPNTYRYNVGVIKILSKILGSDKVIDAIGNDNLSVLTTALANLKPEVKDAEELIQYLDYSHKLTAKMHDEYFEKGNLDEFKKTEDYQRLKIVRNDLTTRLKIYIKAYYRNVGSDDIDAAKEITDIIALLDIVNNELFDPDIEINKANDFFMKDEVGYLMKKYKFTSQQYDEFVKNSKTKKYLINDSEEYVKNK